jgi:hypothetical protein
MIPNDLHTINIYSGYQSEPISFESTATMCLLPSRFPTSNLLLAIKPRLRPNPPLTDSFCPSSFGAASSLSTEITLQWRYL